MEEKNQGHEEIIKGVREQFQEILDGSKQAIYIYLDDNHKLCNQKFANLLGYASEDEWSGVQKPFTEAFVHENSQESLVGTYQKAIEDKVGSEVEITWKKKDDGEVKTKVILVPISYKDETIALHFIEEI